jgi:HNH endonuclease
MSTDTITKQVADSGARFYQLAMRNRPVLNGDIGSLVKIDGLVVAGGGARQVLLLPSASNADDIQENDYITLDAEQWSEFLQRSDVPEILVGPAKAFHRKARYEISGIVQQRIWVADGFKCVYCGRPMGKVQLTIDHFLALELGGANDESNYVSACRKCNKDKGSEDTRAWCQRRGYDYDAIAAHLAVRVV